MSATQGTPAPVLAVTRDEEIPAEVSRMADAEALSIMEAPSIDNPNRCVICGFTTLISSVTGARIHAISPTQPHNVKLRGDEADDA